MEKKSTKLAPKRKPRREPRAILIEVEKGAKSTLEAVELEIKEKLGVHSTDLFRDTQTIVIVREEEGGRRPPPPPPPSKKS